MGRKEGRTSDRAIKAERREREKEKEDCVRGRNSLRWGRNGRRAIQMVSRVLRLFDI